VKLGMANAECDEKRMAATAIRQNARWEKLRQPVISAPSAEDATTDLLTSDRWPRTDFIPLPRRWRTNPAG